MKRLLIILLLLALIVPALPAEKPITEDSFKYNISSKSDIKEKPLITINITPYLSSCMKLDRKIYEKKLPMDRMVTNLVEHINNGKKTSKLVQIYPETVLEVSDDAETIKQSSSNGGMVKHEIYYGYQKSIREPWSQYYKVENCGVEFCRVVRADFSTRQVTIEEITLSKANSITGIPYYSALPKGVKK